MRDQTSSVTGVTNPGGLIANTAQSICPRMVSAVLGDARVVLVNALREAGFSGQIMLRSQHPREMDRPKAAGADIALSPFADATARAGEFVGIRPDSK
jgi:hypothetical protein